MRLGLIPKRDAGIFILSIIRVTVFDARTKRPLEIDGVRYVEAIHGMAAGPVTIALLRIANKRIVERLLKHPGVIEVIFQPGSIYGGTRRISIDEEHVVAFAPPTGRTAEYVEDSPDILAPTVRVHEDVVVLAVQILSMRFRFGNWVREFVFPLRMEAAFFRSWEGIAKFLVIEVEIKIRYILRSIVRQGDMCSPSERHFEIAVHRTVLHGYR